MINPHAVLQGLAGLAWTGAGVATVLALDISIILLFLTAVVVIYERLVSRRQRRDLESRNRAQADALSAQTAQLVAATNAQTLQLQTALQEHSAFLCGHVLNIERIMAWGARSTAVANFDVASLAELDNDRRPTDTGPFRIVKGVG